jgi:hypothetical protein
MSHYWILYRKERGREVYFVRSLLMGFLGYFFGGFCGILDKKTKNGQ